MNPSSMLRGLWRRWRHGASWAYRASRYIDRIPNDLERSIMTLEGGDRHHAKQGRSTGRFRLDGPHGSVSVYIKRHFGLSWTTRLRALLDPGLSTSPAVQEWRGLRTAQNLGVEVPDVVAVGERIGPGLRLQSYLVVAELVGSAELHELIPEMAGRLEPRAFAEWKRRLIDAMAKIVATLHDDHLYHKDLYLCHWFLDRTAVDPLQGCLTLIDLHRLGRHRWSSARWRVKDLAQLLFSTYDVEGITDRDRLRFWRRYRTGLGASRGSDRARRGRVERRSSRRLAWVVRAKAERYRRHNRGG